MSKNTKKGLEKENTKIRTGRIYRVISPSGKSYIGKTINSLDYRKSQHHRSTAGKNSELYDTKFARAIRKYGELLEWSILEDDILQENITEREMFYIQKFDSVLNGYNISAGGNGGDNITNLSPSKKEAFIKKMSEIIKERWKNATEEQRSRQMTNFQKAGTAASTGRVPSAETRRKRSISGKLAWKHQEREREIRREKFTKKNPWSLEGTMERHSCSKEEAKILISEKNKRAWKTRLAKHKPAKS